MMSLNELSDQLYVAVLSDVLDQMGYTHQATRIPFTAYTGISKLIGRCKTTLWADMYDVDPNPYELELKAVDSCQPGDVLIAAAGGSNRSGIWGELLSTAARNSGCVGVIVHGGVRDIDKMREMQFPVFATSKNPYDSQNRQRVIDMDVTVEIDGVRFSPGDIVMADEDGIVVVPKAIEQEVIQAALNKVSAENVTRDAIKNGMKATEAYLKFGVL
ncbi:MULTISPECIES: RraA family protein [unclassified Spirosoma]|uniref:RraA family protein n=1 Tax=unclassified Spirosoma TaxID=2621999 RepID=UPI00095B8F9F|nr:MULTISPECIES: RraA family protein [unclassified Spirosoma]MBN8822353.1 RraA family protein [Spirosoma sp.]OJW72349.1 MAG: dimethylmenaquinone methyltransferase [Spirosoma sp. 48-14]